MDLIWADVYERAVTLFGGQRPGSSLEADIVERFETHPAATVDAIEKLGARYSAGKVRSPWPLVLRELDAAPDRAQIVASDESDKAHAIHLAERYITTAGLFAPDVDDLFAERGRLERWAGDQELRARMQALWQELQPVAEQVEREQLERARRNAAGYFGARAPKSPDSDIPF